MPDILSLGSRGPSVVELQTQLTEVGYGGYLQPFGIDGIYGIQTESAVRAWQDDNGFREVFDESYTGPEEGALVEFNGGPLYPAYDATAQSSYSNYFKANVTRFVRGARNPIELESLDKSISGVWARESDVKQRLTRIASTQTWESLRKALKADPPAIKPVGEGGDDQDSLSNLNSLPGLDSNEMFPLFIYNIVTDTRISIPATPNEITDDVLASFKTETPRGRSVGYVGYDHTENRRVNFSIKVFGELLQNITKGDSANRLPEFVNKVKALEYPNYSSGNQPVVPPRCYVNMYSGIKFTGVCNSVNVTWGGPIKEGAYTYADISFSFTQVSDAPFQAITVQEHGNDNGSI